MLLYASLFAIVSGASRRLIRQVCEIATLGAQAHACINYASSGGTYASLRTFDSRTDHRRDRRHGRGTHAPSRGVGTAAALVKTAPMHILVNSKRMTLYLFSPDKPNKSVCTGIGGPFGAAIRADGSS